MHCTVLDLSNGRIENGTQIQGWAAYSAGDAAFNQYWFIKPYGEGYTIMNVRSGTYMTLSGGKLVGNTSVNTWDIMGGGIWGHQ